MIRAVATSRRALLLVAVLLGGALAALAALALTLDDEEPPPPPLIVESTYIEGVAGTWQRINPLFAPANAVDEDLARLVFAGLIRVGRDGLLLPDLAALPEVSADGRTYTFHLHPDLQWHDGAPVRSLDVAFTIEQIRAPDFKGPPELPEAWSTVEVLTPDLSTVVFRLEEASAPFLARFATIGILPEHLLHSLDAARLFDSPFNAAPVGAGPYRMASVTSNEATLRAYERYHFGRPEIDIIAVRFFPDFPTAQRELEAGRIDGLLFRESLSQAQLDSLDQVDDLTRDHLQRAAYFVLYLNNDQAAFFRDARVRTAISLALDRERLAAAALSSMATPSSSAVTPGTWAYAPEYDRLEIDTETALALLTEAGWHRSPTSGVLIREGAEFRLTIRTDNDPTRVALAGEIARQLEPLGIRATVASTSFAVLRRDFLQERTYDAAVAGWDQGPDPDPYFGWHSSQTGLAGGNIANYADVVSDTLIARGRTELDLAIRRDAYEQFQEIWQMDVPSVILAYPRYLYLRSDSLEATAPGVLFTPADRFLDVHEWRIG